ncbi:MAG: hypothetical protein ABL986_09485 [Vicinamibacterales bacterium]
MLDFTQRARASIEAALDQSIALSRAPFRRVQSPHVPADVSTRSRVFFEELLSGRSVYKSGRAADLDRAACKDVIRRVAAGSANLHRHVAERFVEQNLCARAVWMFAAVERTSSPTRRPDRSPDSAWLHLYVDRRTGFVPRWLVGPCDGDPTFHGAGTIDQTPMCNEWLARRSLSFGRKVRACAASIAVLMLGHNFCALLGDGTTRAMKAGMSAYPWTEVDMAALASEPLLEPADL